MQTVKGDNYYIRDDGVIILITIADVCNTGTTFKYKVIISNYEYDAYGDIYHGRFENFNEYKLLDYKAAKRLDKIMSL